MFRNRDPKPGGRAAPGGISYRGQHPCQMNRARGVAARRHPRPVDGTSIADRSRSTIGEQLLRGRPGKSEAMPHAP